MKSSLNRVFKVIWCRVRMAWVAVSEATKGQGKVKSQARRENRAGQQPVSHELVWRDDQLVMLPLTLLVHEYQARYTYFRRSHKAVAAALLAAGLLPTIAASAPPAPNQLPTGGQVSAGAASIATAGNAMTVTQTSNRAAINWNTFDIGSQAAVNFVQPSASSVALNRITSQNPSQIYGQLSANGQVYLVNPAGIYFAPGANVNVGGIVATTMQMSDADFMAGSTTFTRNGSVGKVINEGTIQANLNGYIAMLAPEVRNSGVLVAQAGTIALAGGESVTLNFGATNKLDSITVAASQIDTLIENRHAIQAPNGLVILSTKALAQLTASIINDGVIEAQGVTQVGGRIILDGGTVANNGSLNVSSNTARGGNVTITGDAITLTGNSSINASGAGGGGNVLVGGDWQGSNGTFQATTVNMQDGAVIQASATQQGDGGKVVLWSQGTTNFSGSIFAQGAGQSGSGGNAEVSGKTLLNYTGYTNLLGSQGGSVGTLLLDPYNLYITSGSGGSTTASSNNSILGNSTLTTALSTANVNVTTGSSGSQTGTIGILADIVSSSTNNLTLTASNNVVLDGNVAIGGQLTVNATGNFVMGTNLSSAAGMTIVANGGFVKNGTGTSYLTGNITTNGTAINISGPVQIANFNGNPLGLSTNGGNITLSGAVSNYSGTAQNYAVTMASNLYDGVTASTVTGNTTGIYLAYSAGSNVFFNQSGLPIVNYLLVGGGGGGGQSNLGVYQGGGGGGGGVYSSTYSLSGNSVNISVGNGGTLSSYGGDTSLGTNYVGGGGGGGNTGNGGIGSSGNIGIGNNNPSVLGRIYLAGGSGGGGGSGSNSGSVGGTGTSQNGYSGGRGIGSNGGGGGGANGNATTINTDGYGGLGLSSNITGTNIAYGSGGAGYGENPTANTGGGGGANLYGGSNAVGANGTVIISYAVGNATTGATSALKLSAGSGNVTLGSTVSNISSLEVNAGSASSIAGAISGIGSTLTNSGSGTLNVNGAATYTGLTTVNTSSIVFTNNSTPTTSGFAGAGNITIQPNVSSSFTSNFTPTYTYASALTGLVLGSTSNRANISISSDIGIAGPISIYGGIVNVSSNLASSNTGDISLIAYSNITNALNVSANILKTGGGLSNISLSSYGGVLSSGNITASNSAGANVVLWSGVGNATSNSTVTVNNVTTNGGNLWVGGSNTTLGSTVWHGLTVGNSGAQINLCGSLSVGAGDVMLWQKSGASMNVTSASITDTTGTIVLVSDGYSGTGLAINSNGTLNLESSSGNFGGGFIWNGTYGSPATSLVGSNTLSNVTINNLNPGLSANTTSLQNLVIGNYTGGGQSSDTVYSFANTGNITVGNHIFMPNSIVLQGKDLVLNAQIGAAPTASLSDPTKGLTLVSSGNVSEYTGLPVLNNDVRFIGGNITLTASNLIDQMSATGVGNLTIANNYGFSGTPRTLGLEGISASGLIKIQNTGAISVDQNVVTTSTANASASPAILLAAGSGLAVGNTTAGFDLYMNGGTVSTGANGLSLIYTGSIANSTGVTTSVGSGSGKFRYNSTLASTGYNTTAAPLTTGVYAIYRESPTLNLTQASNTSVYGVANSSNANTYNNITFNAVNGDSLAQIFGSTPTVTISGGLSSTNYYNAGTHGINITQSANNLGYGPVNYTNGTLTITQAPLGITANSTYNGVTTFNNLVNGTSYNLTGLKNGEVIASANLTVSNSNVSANGSNYVTGLTVVSGNASISNYNITTAYNDAIATNTTNTFTLAQANLTITANNTSTQYGLGTTLGTTAFTPVGLQNSETIGGVTLSSAGVANTTNVGLYNITATGATGGSFIASNYNIGYVNGTLNITQAPLTLVAGNLTRTYGAANPTTDTVTLAGGTTLYNGNTIGNATVSSPAISTTNAGQTANLTPSAVAFTNGLASNYNITYTNGALTISQAPLGITANSTYNGSTNFNGSVNGTNYNLTGLQNGETILTANLAVSNANVASANNFVTGLTRLTGTADMSNYVINGSYNSAPTTNTTNTFNLAQANLTITANSSTKVYGQNITYSGTEFTPVGLQGSDTLTAANISSSGAVANASVNGGTNYTIAISNATGANGYLTSNYNISYVTGNLTVTPAPLGIATTGTYSGTTLVTPATYNVTGLVNSETISGISSVVVNNANVNQASYVTSLNLAANSTANMANYRLNSVANTTLNTTTTNTFVLAQANATITPNNDAIFVGQTLPGTYNITINGLVNGETSPAGLVNGTVTNSATANSSAGSYNLTANGFSSTNYHFAYTNGTFTVVPANKLLIQTGNAITTYGTNATLSPTSVQYLYNTTLVANLTLASNGTLGNNTYLYNDPNGGTVTLALSPANTTVSGSGNLNVYNYQMGSSVINQTSSNFNGTTTTLGTLAVSALTVTPQAGNISKVYDGTTSMSGLSIGLSPSIIAGDNVNISGGGAFSQANAGTNLSYTVSGLQLSGTNAANYVLSGGSTFSGSNGTIAPRTITLTNTQVYSGSTVLTNVSIGNLVGNQTLSYSGASANSSHVTDNGSNYITAITLSNGSAGGLASNYQLPILNATNAPVVITSAPLTVVAVGNISKTYDGLLAANVAQSNYQITGFVSGDTSANLSSASAMYNNTHVVNANNVTVAGLAINSVSGNLSSQVTDYALNTSNLIYGVGGQSGTFAAIAPANLTVVGTTVSNKIYDGTTTATLTNGTLQGAVAGDSLALLQAGNFISPYVANGVPVTASDSFSSSNSPIGSLTSDYILIQPVGLTGNILPATVPATNSWIYQSTMVQGGTTLYLPLPKTQTAASPVALDAIAFNDEIIFLKNSNEESTAMEVSAIKNDISPVLSDWSFGAIPPLTRLPEVDSMKAVEQDGKIFLINTESKRENRLDTVSLFSSQLIERDN